MMAALQIQRRNVVVLGKTGAGKSTVANKIVGKEVFTVAKESVASVTKEPSSKEAKVTVDDIQYYIKAIDTVGLFDTGNTSHAAIFRQAKTFFRDKVPEGISLVLFVFKEGRFTKEENVTFQSLIDNFGKERISDISALIVTCCENMDSHARSAYVKELEEDPLTKPITSFMRKGIYTVGFPDVEKAGARLKPIYEDSAKEDAEVLRKLIQDCEDPMILSKELLSETFWDKLASFVADSKKGSCTML